MRILLVTPPMSDVNQPYPATAQLVGFLAHRGIAAQHADASIEFVNAMLSLRTLRRVRDTLEAGGARSPAARFFVDHFEALGTLAAPVLRFLQGHDPTLQFQLSRRLVFPQGPEFARATADTASWAKIEARNTHDRAMIMCGIYLTDLNAAINEFDPEFQFHGYAKSLALSQADFNPLLVRLAQHCLTDEVLDEITARLLAEHRPDLLGVTIPFPGNLWGAFRMAATARRLCPDIKIVFGGGYCNTDLRDVSDPRVFDYPDYICLDDGERPLLSLVEHLSGVAGEDHLVRTLLRRDGRVILVNNPALHDIPQKDVGVACYVGLPDPLYFAQTFGTANLNDLTALYTSHRWNKLMIAHGCYWRKCAFCDVHLDYVGRYDYGGADVLVERVRAIVEQTGISGFHFVDEACPPTALAAFAQRLLASDLRISWFGNIRFDAAFKPNLTASLARSGCVAVTGGLEVASDRLLKLMEKGTTVAQVARVAKAFADTGVLVHGYLMYGFPTQSEQEVVDSLEVVRQLFSAGLLHSAFWHRFAVTRHSPVFRDPERFGVTLLTPPTGPDSGGLFARNIVAHKTEFDAVYDRLTGGLQLALGNYMMGSGLDLGLQTWFDSPVPEPQVPWDLITSAVGLPPPPVPESGFSRMISAMSRMLEIESPATDPSQRVPYTYTEGASLE